jgi:hypothetical protein
MELVVEDTGAALLLAANGGVLPSAVLGPWDVLPFQPTSNRPRADVRANMLKMRSTTAASAGLTARVPLSPSSTMS